MNRKLDIALTKSLRELLGTSGKRIAVYFKEGVHEPQILAVYQNETPPTSHPLRPDFSFAGFLNFETGDVEMWAGEARTRKSITPIMVARAVIGLLWLCLKMAYWCIIGIVLLVGLFAGKHPPIHSTLGHRQ
jgi:hypothetical protein